MLYQIIDGTVTLGGEAVLSHINFEIHGTEKIAVVGRNGAGKTTLLNVIAENLSLDRDDRRQGLGQGNGILKSRNLNIFRQQQDCGRGIAGSLPLPGYL